MNVFQNLRGGDVGIVEVEHVCIPDAVCVVAVSGHANILVIIPPSFASCRIRWQYSLCSRLNSMWPAASELWSCLSSKLGLSSSRREEIIP